MAALVALAMTPSLASAEMIKPGAVEFVDGMSVPESLTGEAGDPAAGRKAMADRKLGNCLACHTVSEMSDQPFQGNVGPSLDGVASRWEPETLRAIVVNAKHIFGDQTIMPGFYTLDVGVDVAEQFQGETILSAQDVENVVAYLMTLKEQ